MSETHLPELVYHLFIYIPHFKWLTDEYMIRIEISIQIIS